MNGWGELCLLSCLTSFVVLTSFTGLPPQFDHNLLAYAQRGTLSLAVSTMRMPLRGIIAAILDIHLLFSTELYDLA